MNLCQYIIVDSQGLLIGVLIIEANASERLGAIVVFHEVREKLTQLEVVWVSLGVDFFNRHKIFLCF